MRYQVREVKSFDEFLGMKEQWNALLARSYCNIPFLRHEWLTAWWQHFSGDRTLAIIVIQKREQLVLAVPLMEERITWLGLSFVVLRSLTNHHSNLYHFILEKDQDEALGSFWAYLKARPAKWDLILLEEVPAHVDCYTGLLGRAKSDRFLFGVWERGSAAYLSIGSDWEQYWQSLKAKFRSNVRNRTKRIAAIGEVRHEVVQRPALVADALKLGFAIEQKSWKGSARTAIACNPVLVGFYTAFARAASEQGWLRLSLLKVGDRYAAFDYSLAYNDSVYCMKIGCDPDYSKYSVGQLLCGRILKNCFEENYNKYEFLGKITVQKSDWTDASYRIIWIYLYNRTMKGVIHYFLKFILSKQLKKMRRQIDV
jgi:CelD/BcsL family acetyltransferase involved in cellulose biosynthesis